MTRVKVCGVARAEDARLAVELGAWAIGMVFHPDSPRAVDPGTAEQIGHELKRKAEVVGVFVNWPLDELEHMADRASLTVIQLHGDEGPAFCTEAGRRTGCRVVKAVRVASGADLQALERFRTDLHLLDTAAEGLRGGSGRSWDWSLAAQRRSKVPAILSGGLTPDNVAEGIAAVRPYAVDVASGVEASPGIKDAALVEAFIAASHPQGAAV